MSADRRIALVLRHLAAGSVVVALVVVGYLLSGGADPANACSSVDFGTQTRGHGIKVAQALGGPWHESSIPPLAGQIRSLTRNLYPGAAGGMVAYVRNTGSESGAPNISITKLADSGGTYTPPERLLEPRRDVGDLSANIVLTITYASTRRPFEAPRIVARGTLRDLAARGRVFAAPIPLQPYSARGSESGIWRVDLAVPRVADNRIQGDRTSCTFVFGLVQMR